MLGARKDREGWSLRRLDWELISRQLIHAVASFLHSSQKHKENGF